MIEVADNGTDLREMHTIFFSQKTDEMLHNSKKEKPE